jgi:hypothetical protein
MKFYVHALFLFCVSFLACAQPGHSPATSNIEENVSQKSRLLLEEPIVYPPNQVLSIQPIEKQSVVGDPSFTLNAHTDGKFIFDKSSGLDKGEDPYPVFNFYFDNNEPQVLKNPIVKWDLPEGDHIVSVALLDGQGNILKYPGAHEANFIRIKQGAITQKANAGVMLYYNQPRKEYQTGEAVYLDYLVTGTPLDEAYRMIAIIDGQTFEVDPETTYEIIGLMPGSHMVEIQLIRFGELFNKPLNPSRMTFTTK